MRKIGIKKVSVAILSFAMVVSCMAYTPVASAGQETGDITNFEVVNGYDGEAAAFGLPDASDYTMELSASTVELDKSTALPATWDSRKKGWVTKVKNQGDYYAGWSFAANSAMETSLIKQGIKVSGKIATKKNLNFSEKHTIYFCYHPFNDPLKNNGGDTFEFEDDKTIYMNSSGNGYMTSVTIANGEGPVAEKVAAYNAKEVSKKHNYKSVAHLKKSVNYIMYDKDGNPLLTPVKKAIKKSGSVAVEMGWNDLAYDEEGDCYNPTGQYNSYRHTVTIVGWDDNYDKSNFEGTYGAPHYNGAWLVKNSWGKDWGRDGYFWISYYDKGLTQAWEFVMESVESYDNCYFYSNMPDINFVGYYYPTLKAANTYKITGKQKITAVGFGIYSDAKYSVQLYKNSKVGSPQSGKKLLKKPLTGSSQNGYITLKLKNPIKVAKGDRITVVVTATAKSGDVVYFWYDADGACEEFMRTHGGVYTAKPSGYNAMVNPTNDGWIPSEDMSLEHVYTPCINLYTKNR